jgi:hypothetical protein
MARGSPFSITPITIVQIACQSQGSIDVLIEIFVMILNSSDLMDPIYDPAVAD